MRLGSWRLKAIRGMGDKDSVVKEDSVAPCTRQREASSKLGGSDDLLVDGRRDVMIATGCADDRIRARMRSPIVAAGPFVLLSEASHLLASANAAFVTDTYGLDIGFNRLPDAGGEQRTSRLQRPTRQLRALETEQHVLEQSVATLAA